MLVDSAIYVGGHRTASCALGEVRRTSQEREGFAWVDLFEPSEEELGLVTRDFDLHELAVEDAIKAHQRPKVERYGGSIFVVLKAAWYRDETEAVEFGEIHAFLGPDFVVTVRHGEAPSLKTARDRLESEPGLLREGPAAVLYAVADHVVDGYEPVLEGLENDIEEIEEEVFAGAAGISRRIYGLSREVIEFRRAAQPLARVLERLGKGDMYEMDLGVKRRLHDVHDHVLRVSEQVESFRELLSNILNVNLTLVGVEQNAGMQRQNEVVQKISAWAAILIVPTIVTGVYGMNFRYMPELSWTFGYPFALALIALISGLLYLGFRRASWL